MVTNLKLCLPMMARNMIPRKNLTLILMCPSKKGTLVV